MTFGGLPAHDIQVVEIFVLRNDRESILSGILPNLIVAGAVQPD